MCGRVLLPFLVRKYARDIPETRCRRVESLDARFTGLQCRAVGRALPRLDTRAGRSVFFAPGKDFLEGSFCADHCHPATQSMEADGEASQVALLVCFLRQAFTGLMLLCCSMVHSRNRMHAALAL